MQVAIAPLALVRQSPGMLAFTHRLHGALHSVNLHSGLAKAVGPDSLCQLPAGIAVDDAQNLYLVESRSARVVVLRQEGTVLQQFSQDVQIFPTDVAFDPVHRRIYVTQHGA